MRKNLKCGVVSEVQCKWFTEAIGCGLPDDVECLAERETPKLSVIQQLEKDLDDLCDNYCKYPAMYEGREDELYDGPCTNCPIGRIL